MDSQRIRNENHSWKIVVRKWKKLRKSQKVPLEIDVREHLSVAVGEVTTEETTFDNNQNACEDFLLSQCWPSFRENFSE